MNTISTAKNLLDKHPRAEWLIPLVFCLVLLTQLLFSVHEMSQQADEATHLYAGYRVLKCGDYGYGREHPPLAKILVAIPLLWSNAPMDCAAGQVGIDEEDRATRWLYSQDGWWRTLSEARAVASLFSVALCLGVWIAARRMFGRATAVLSTAILVFEPNILGHGALVLNDVLVSALFLFTIFSFYLWTRRRSLPFLVLTGFITGLALLTKHSAILLIPTLCLLAAVEPWLEKREDTGPVRASLRNLGAVMAILVIAAAIIWCGYGMRYAGGRAASESMLQDPAANTNSAEVRLLKGMRDAHVMPLPYLDGLIDIRGLVTGGLDAYVLGRYYAEAPWFFYPLTMVIKFTVPFLVMLVLGVVGIIAFGRERRTEFMFLLLPALLFLAASLRVQRTSGIWHLFPMFPFLLIAAAAGCVYFARRYHWAGPTLACLLALHAISSLRSYPNYLSYANELWGGPQNLYKRLPLTDVGQAYMQLSKYMEQHPNTPCWVASNYYSFFYTAQYKSPCIPMGVLTESDLTPRMKGIVFVSSSSLQIEGQPGGPLAPFYASEPKARLGGSAMLVYEGEFDTSVAAARALDNETGAALAHGDSIQALSLAKQAAELAQSSSSAHKWYCVALALNGRPQEAFQECSLARRLALADPWKQGEVQEIERIARQLDLLPPAGAQ
jgi:hypothetical protein